MPISDQLKRAVLRINSDEVVSTLLTISGDGFSTFYVCDNSADVVSNGQTFTAYPFEIELPGDREDASLCRLRIANVSREIGQALEAATGQITVKVQLVMASTPDVIEKEFAGFDLRRSSRDVITVEGELQMAQFTNEPWPKIRATVGRLPGLFPQ
jgi:hypothetical protein